VFSIKLWKTNLVFTGSATLTWWRGPEEYFHCRIFITDFHENFIRKAPHGERMSKLYITSIFHSELLGFRTLSIVLYTFRKLDVSVVRRGGDTYSFGSQSLHSPSLSLSLMLRPTVSQPVCLGMQRPSGAYDQIFITVRQLRVCWRGALSLTRGRVCRLQLLRALASGVIFGS
jgi:hypothetical protein